MNSKIFYPLLVCFLFLAGPAVPRGADFLLTDDPAEVQNTSLQGFEVLTPMGDILWAPGDPLLFQWDPLDNYTGDYRLKILEQALGDPLPAELPDTGLFFEETNISDTKYGYPIGAPTFLEGNQYAWQVETMDPVSGLPVKTINVGVISPFTFGGNGCEITVSGTPTLPICPGECVELAIDFPALGVPFVNRLIVYSDAEDLSAVSVGDAGLPPYTLADLDSAPLESPYHYEGSAMVTSTSLEICVDAGNDQPINFSIYYFRDVFACDSDPMGPSCCHDVVSFDLEVLDIPDFTNLELAIKDLTVTDLLTEVCSGDPAHFSILNLPSTDGVDLEWQYNDQDGNGWQPITGTPFNLFTFAVLNNNDALTIDCASSTTGYVDRTFRARLSYEEDGNICAYFTTDYPLRICCPITTAALNITTEDPFDLSVGLCEGDTVRLDVEFIPDDPFLNPPGEFVEIVWELNGTVLDLDNPYTFQIPDTIVGSEDICISATVTNCAGKAKIFSQCINVDPKPICGTIDVITPGIEMIAPDTYQICPNTALTLQAIGFDNCIPFWEYSYDEENWNPMGSSNTIQNTNLLIEGNNEVIYYRIQCKPESNPSGCNPCFSKTIKIVEDQHIPDDPFINCAPTLWCAGVTIPAGVPVVEPGVTYTWYVNGVPYSEGPNTSFVLDEDKCFSYTAATECYLVSSNVCCLEACVITAAISCPLLPEECACLGEEIELDALSCTSSCSESELTYEWSWVDQDGNPQTSTDPSIQNIPIPEGTTYTLTVTDELSGCSDTTTRTIVPCDCDAE